MNAESITVIICTRNPPVERLDRVLDALRGQTLDQKYWQLCLVDNGSEAPLADRIDLAWHANASIIVETRPGLTPARLAGIRKSNGHVVFVDDDNLLAPDYLERAVGHLERKPWVGAFGGNIELAFESEPPDWTTIFHGMLAERRFERDLWSNAFVANPAVPCGAGMVVRREVAEAYLRQVEADPRRLSMDRRADSMISDGDTDLALTACDLGLGCGQFADLALSHLIPDARLSVEYLKRLAHGMAFSGVMVRSLREETRSELKPPARYEKPRSFWQNLWLTTEQRRVRRAWAKGRDEALKELGL